MRGQGFIIIQIAVCCLADTREINRWSLERVLSEEGLDACSEIVDRTIERALFNRRYEARHYSSTLLTS